MKSPPPARPPPRKPRAADRSKPPRYRQKRGIVARAAGGHLFLAGRARDSIHELNETGAAVWKLLEAPRSEAEIVAVFAAAFPKRTRPALTRDVKVVLSDLVAAGYAVAVP